MSEVEDGSPDVAEAPSDNIAAESAALVNPASEEAVTYCDLHPQAVAITQCQRCGENVCISCFRPAIGICQVCAAAPKGLSRKLSVLQMFTGACAGAFFAILVTGGVTTVAAVLYAKSQGIPTAEMLTVVTSLPLVILSVVLTAGSLIGASLLTPKLAKVSIKDALGFRSAPLICFIVAPIGILALGPTSDLLVRGMKHLLPNFTFGALDSLTSIATENSPFLLWPFIALAPGFGEEIFFRGLIQRAFGAGILAVTVSALTFSFFHMDPHHVAGVIPLGFYLAFLAARTGSLWVPVVAHTLNNTAALIGSQFVDLEVGIEADPPLWWAPVGWAIAAVVIVVIWKATTDRDKYGHLRPEPEEAITAF